MSTPSTQYRPSSLTRNEIDSQPAIWREALATRSDQATALLARPGERVLIIGCGTSAFLADSIAELREAAGFGLTDAAYASEPRRPRDYDTVIALTRSGTTTEVIAALSALPAGVPTVAITGVADSPVATLCDEVLLLDFADEQSVIQTRFPTTALLLARAAFGEDVSGLADLVESKLGEPLYLDAASFQHFVYLGHGWTRGLADEAALKIREAAQAWAESYPALDYRHGPLAVAGPSTHVWMIGFADDDLVADITATGATVRTGDADPLIDLVQAQRLAVAVAEERGLDPDAPRHLSRSIMLDDQG